MAGTGCSQVAAFLLALKKDMASRKDNQTRANRTHLLVSHKTMANQHTPAWNVLVQELAQRGLRVLSRPALGQAVGRGGGVQLLGQPLVAQVEAQQVAHALEVVAACRGQESGWVVGQWLVLWHGDTGPTGRP